MLSRNYTRGAAIGSRLDKAASSLSVNGSGQVVRSGVLSSLAGNPCDT